MNKLRLISLLNRLKDVTCELECELKGDPSSYLAKPTYEDVLEYYQTNDHDSEEGL